MFEIKRREAHEIRSMRGWLLVYGRRKVGKTFLLRKSIDSQAYILITKVGNAIVEEDGKSREMSVDDALARISALTKEGKCVIIDEFQRLRKEVWERIALLHPNGRIIASGSSSRLVKEVFDKRSPLLGLFSLMRLDIASYANAVTSLKGFGLKDTDALIWGAIIRDPWIIPMVDLGNNMNDEIAQKAKYMIMSVDGLVGEIFEEEDRALTNVYDSMLRLVGEGIWKPAEIAGILSANRVVDGGLATVTGVMSRLTEMGLLRKTPLWRTKGSRYYYKSSSPLLSVLYYLDQKYRISEENYRIDPAIIGSVIGKEIQSCIGSLMAENLSGREAYTILEGGKGDIDIVVLDKRGKKALRGYEVKMGKFDRREASNSIGRIRSNGIGSAGLISLAVRPETPDKTVEALGPEDLVRIAREISSNSFGDL